MIFNFLKKKINTDQRELLEKTIDGIETMLQTQIVMITGNLSPRDSLPKDKWVYGYIYGGWVNPFEPINKGRLGSTQEWRIEKPKRYYY